MQSPLSQNRSTPARILNSLTEGFNKIHRIPKYIVVITETDIVNGLRSNGEIKRNMEELLQWLVNNINKVIRRHREDLKDKCPAALACSFEPMIVWVAMLKRPQIAVNNENYMKALDAQGWYNYLMEELLVPEHYMYILSIDSLSDNMASYFKANGKLSDTGIEQFWKKLDYNMKKFDRRQIDLKPVSKREPPFLLCADRNNQQQNNFNDDVQHSRSLSPQSLPRPPKAEGRRKPKNAVR